MLYPYGNLKIPEVWFWENGKLAFYTLENEEYKSISQSQLLPNLDVKLLMDCINIPSHTQALGQFRQTIKN